MEALDSEDICKWSIRVVCSLALALALLILATSAPAGASPAAAPQDTATPTVTHTPPSVEACGPDANYTVAVSTGQPLVPGTEDIGNHCIYCTTPINLPFNFTLYGQEFNSAWVSNSGNIEFSSTNPGHLPEC